MPTRTVNIFGNRKLDARRDRLDLRDRPYVPPVVTLPPCYPPDANIATWFPAYEQAGLVLDQKAEGSCTGFGLACVIHYLLWRRKIQRRDQNPITPVSTRMLYHLARFYDEWPGEDYEGSSCRGALKAWHRHGVCSEDHWPYLNAAGGNEFVPPQPGWHLDAMQRRLGVYYRIDFRSVVDVQAAILEVGAVFVSADVHDGWNVSTPASVTGHASLPAIGPLADPKSVGGHAFALVGYNPHGFVVQNSWGPTWGSRGFAVLPYRDWAYHGSDAWVCALGVPGDGRETSPVVRVHKRPVGQGSRPGLRQRFPVKVSPAVMPWCRARAYGHAVVMGNEGRPLHNIVAHADGAESVKQVVAVAPQVWFDNKQADGPQRIVLYAHGGLNSEEESLNRIRVLAPYFEANDIYPIFITWKTGLRETLWHIIEDELLRAPQREGNWLERVTEYAIDKTDGFLEAVAGRIAKPVWNQMKQNAEASLEDGGGIALTAKHLATLTSQSDVELHVIGHSAGAILLGYFLEAAKQYHLTVGSCTLYAPACTIAFANEHYRGRAVRVAKENIHVHVLSDEREREDSVGPYRKSLLYLVSRALEKAHKTPLLGLANTFDPAANAADAWSDAQTITDGLKSLRRWWRPQEATNLHTISERHVSTGPKGRWIQATHGCFDNDAATVTKTLKRILGSTPAHKVESLDY